METNKKIKTKDNKTIYGTLNSTNNKNLAIFVHGLTGNKEEHIFYNAKNIFTEKGIDTFRFNLYDWQENARKLSECSIYTHSSDIDEVVNKFKNKYEKIILIGHSLGGPSILFSKQKVDLIVLWDPSIDINLEEDSKYIPEISSYVTNWGIECILNKEMIESCKETSSKIISKKFIKPTLIVYGSKGILEKRWKKANIKNNKLIEEVTIKGASHCFDEENIEQELFKHTIKFIKKQIKIKKV